MRKSNNILVGNREGKRLLRRPKDKWEKMSLGDIRLDVCGFGLETSGGLL
jgi:hypothetical protein